MLPPELRQALIQAVINCETERVASLAERVLEEGIDPLEALEDGLTKGLQMVGDRFARGEAFLPELVRSGEVMKRAMEVFRPYLLEQGTTRKSLGRIVIGTVKGDIHDLGKNIVVTMLEIMGFEVIDLGVDVPAEHFLQAVVEHRPQVVGLSALMSTTVAEQRTVIEALKKAGLRNEVGVAIGGAAVTAEWTESIGADGYALDAITAVSMIRKLLDIRD